jgi:hypothetical protein
VSKRESAIKAVISTLESSGTFEVQRNTAIPTTPLSVGLVVVRDGNPGDPEITMSPIEYHYEHPIELEVFAVGQDLDFALDTLLGRIANLVEADKTLGGFVESLYLTAPNFDLTIDSSIRCKAASINVVVFYSTYSPLN